MPSCFQCLSDLHNVFETLERYLGNRIQKANTVTIPVSLANHTDFCICDEFIYATFFVGTRVRFLWNKDEIGDSGWRPEWYVAEVQGADFPDDTIDVVYVSEPESIYSIEVMDL